MRKLLVAGLFIAFLGTVILLFGQPAMVTRGEQVPVTKPKGLGIEPSIGILPDQREATAKILNILLADEYLLYVKTQNFHWNVTGLMFNDLHLFFGNQYEKLAEIVDRVAERVRALGHRSLGTMKEFIEHARLSEQPKITPEAKEMISILLTDHETIIKSLRVDIETVTDEYFDAGSSNLMTDLLEKHEKMAWMLRSYLS